VLISKELREIWRDKYVSVGLDFKELGAWPCSQLYCRSTKWGRKGGFLVKY
jgi:hypothetical protein